MNYIVSKQIFSFKLIVLSCVMLVISCMTLLTSGEAAELTISIDNPPINGTVIAMLFNSRSTFVDLRDPARVITLPSGGTSPGRIPDLASGEYALVVYQDENGNGRLDENFIGIPSEPLGFSNRYWPQGPPTFSHAAFTLSADETKTIDIKLQSVFGKSGLLGVGVGVISNTSPYRDAKPWNVQPIPAISYIGDRVQILGLTARCGILDWDDFALAATASYRFGAYREKDSPYLQGMGNRDGTLLGGFALQLNLPEGFKFSTGYEHDLLDRTGGGIGRIGVKKAFQQDLLTISPHISLNWLTDKLADYEYGVSAPQARTDRPAYHPGDAVNFEVGVTIFREIYTNWQLILSSSVVFLPSNLKNSPIVDQSQVFNSFFAVTRRY
ncbi:MAG: MipA/OmpV family protein [Desulfuromonadaceae bacterium]